MSTTKPWEVRFQDLLDFKAQHGHCNVPRAKATDAPHRSLGRWVNKMRGHYKQHMLGLPSGPLTTDRIKLLEKAGFKWDGRNTNKSRPKKGGSAAATDSPSRNSLRIRLSPSKLAAAAAATAEEQNDANGYDDYDDDEQVCSGCEGARDFQAEAADEPILLCDGDGCDREFHLGCTDLTAIPQGDFFCGLCDSGPAEKKQPGAPAELPPIVCPHCSKSFKSKSGLGSHILTCRQKPAPQVRPNDIAGEKGRDEASFSCQHCGKTFKRKSGLVTHLNMNTCQGRSKPSAVLVCPPAVGAGASSSKFGVPLVCNFCTKKFTRLNGLSMHVKTCPKRLAKVAKALLSPASTAAGTTTAEGQGEQDHICIYCTKSFLKKAGLAMHEKTCAVRLLSKQEPGALGSGNPAKKRKRKSKDQELDEPESLEDICFGCRGARDDEAEAKDVPVLLCDGLNCEREYHLFCTEPRITEVPDGHFFCSNCAPMGTSAHLEAYLDQSEERSADFRSSKQYVLHLLRNQMKESLSAEDDAEANKDEVDTEGRAPKRVRKSESSLSTGKEDEELSQWGRERPPRSEISRALDLHAIATAERGRRSEKVPSTPSTSDDTSKADSKVPGGPPPSFFIGKPIQLYCPLDNSYHQGRIVDWRKSTRGFPQYYGTGQAASAEFLVRFPPGVNGRKIGLRRWIILEEHCVAVSLAIVFAEQKKVKGLAGWKPAQLMARSSLELIPVRRLLVDDGEPRGLAFFFGDSASAYLKLRDETTSFFSRSFSTRRGEKVEKVSSVSVLEGLEDTDVKMATPTKPPAVATTSTLVSPMKSPIRTGDGTSIKLRDVAVHQAFLEYEEQRRVNEWGRLLLKDPTHVRALTAVDEYNLGPLAMPMDDDVPEGEEKEEVETPDATMQHIDEDEKKEEDTVVDPEPAVTKERKQFPAYPQIERGVDRRWLSHLISGEKSQMENSMDAFAGMKVNSVACLPLAMARLQEQRKRGEVGGTTSIGPSTAASSTAIS